VFLSCDNNVARARMIIAPRPSLNEITNIARSHHPNNKLLIDKTFSLIVNLDDVTV